jgi:glycine hydroxymethyltransferase
MITEILNLVKKHEQWRGKDCINLIPSENVMSPHVRSLLSSEIGHRYTSPDSFYMGTQFMDKIETLGETIAKEVFKAKTADLRPLSGHIADWILLANLTRQGDIVMCISPEDGGYPGIWKNGLSSTLNLKVAPFPFSKDKMNIQVNETKELIAEIKPKILVFGASLLLFPNPVKELKGAANDVDAHIGFDGSHVMGLIAGGEFQQPLEEGSSALFGSTHKSFFGPQGGILLANKEIGSILKEKIYPAFVDNAHWNRIAALTLALAEMKKFGCEYARQIIRNAQCLARALAENGLPIVGSALGYTMSHQVLMDFGGYKHGRQVAEKLAKCNIIADCGVRLGTSEVTRRGMKEDEMEKIAQLIHGITLGNTSPEKIKGEVKKLAEEFSNISYCFQL